jgi:pyridoxamine 5'-phosphate oxidase
VTTPSLRDRLRALPTFTGDLPDFPTADVPEEPRALFEEWLQRAIDDGLRIPHAATLSTSDAHGDVSARTLILKDVDETGWWFATRSDGRKARDLADNPRAALTFLWRELGRQVRLSGSVVDAGAEASAADFLARPVHSRAAAVIGTQSAPLGSREEYSAAFTTAKDAAAAHPDAASDIWRAMILRPVRVEFWASTPTDGQIRLRYERSSVEAPWRHGLLWP